MRIQLIQFFTCLAVLSSLVNTERSIAQDDHNPPKEFTPLFNGVDLAGRYGQRDPNPYGLAELSRLERAEIIVADHQDMIQHWTVENGMAERFAGEISFSARSQVMKPVDS
ncbi:MAG: hypothetical protein O3C21_09130 [Verrucomicrobia bacterium]|nr:hypothetical protein [Verrucomicrobiota bacterium]